MTIADAVRSVTPELLAVAWLPGTAALCVLSMADTYTGLLLVQGDAPAAHSALTAALAAYDSMGHRDADKLRALVDMSPVRGAGPVG